MTEAQEFVRSTAFSNMTYAEHRLHIELHLAAIDIASIPTKLESAREEVKLMNFALMKSITAEAAVHCSPLLATLSNQLCSWSASRLLF